MAGKDHTIEVSFSEGIAGDWGLSLSQLSGARLSRVSCRRRPTLHTIPTKNFLADSLVTRAPSTVKIRPTARNEKKKKKGRINSPPVRQFASRRGVVPWEIRISKVRRLCKFSCRVIQRERPLFRETFAR